MYSAGVKQDIEANLKTAKMLEKKTSRRISGLHPQFPGNGVLILGQEQERICGGFDGYDSLSADVSEFQVSSLQEI